MKLASLSLVRNDSRQEWSYMSKNLKVGDLARERAWWSTAGRTIATPSLPAISRWSSSRLHASSSVASSSRQRLSIQCPRGATSGPAVSVVLLGDVEDWTSGVPLDVAVKRIDPKGSNPTNAGLTDPSEARPRKHSCFVRGR